MKEKSLLLVPGFSEQLSPFCLVLWDPSFTHFDLFLFPVSKHSTRWEIQTLWQCGSVLPLGDPELVEEGSSPNSCLPLGFPETLLRFLILGDQ